MRVTITVRTENAGDVEVEEESTMRNFMDTDAKEVDRLLIEACAKVRRAYEIAEIEATS